MMARAVPQHPSSWDLVGGMCLKIYIFTITFIDVRCGNEIIRDVLIPIFA